MKKSTNNIHTILLLLILPLLAGCSTKFSSNLREADKMLFTDYKRGEMMLDSIRKADPNMSTADLQYYKLLKLKADDKAYRPIDKKKEYIDSLVTYFQNAGDDDLLAEAYFYAGRVYFEIGEIPHSLSLYQKAEKKIGKENYYLQADLNSQTALIYCMETLYDDAITSLKKTYIADSILENKRGILFDIKDIGEDYIGKGNLPKAIFYGKLGVKKSIEFKDSFMEINFHHLLATAYTHQKKYDLAEIHIQKCFPCKYNIGDGKSGLYMTASELYHTIGKDSTAAQYDEWLLDSGTVFAKEEVALQKLILSIKAHRAEDSEKYLALYVPATKTVRKLNNTEPIKRMEELYNYKWKEQENRGLKQANTILILIIGICIALLSIIVTISLFVIHTNKQNKKMLQLKLEKYERLQLENEKRKSTNLNSIESLKQTCIYKTISNEIVNETYKMTDLQWKELEKVVNQTYPNFTQNLYSFYEVNKNEMKVSLLLKIEISPTNIAKFMVRSKEAINSIRSRLFEKTFHQKGSAPKWDEFIRSL